MTQTSSIPGESIERRYVVGAEVVPSGGTSFRVWAPGKNRVAVVLCDEQERTIAEFAMDAEERGYFSRWIAEANANVLYGFYVDDQRRLLPDPASRFQPQGPGGPSQVIDPGRFPWSDTGWKGVCR